MLGAEKGCDEMKSDIIKYFSDDESKFCLSQSDRVQVGQRANKRYYSTVIVERYTELISDIMILGMIGYNKIKVATS